MLNDSHIEPCTQAEMDRLFDKQFVARMWLHKNPFAFAMNMKIRRYFQKKVERVPRRQ